MAVLSSLLISTLISIAAEAVAQGLMIGIPMNRVKKLQSKGMTTQQVNSTAMTILNNLKEQSSTLYNDAINKLSSIPTYNLTGELKSYVNSATRNLMDKADIASKISNNIDTAIANVSNKIGEYDVIPDKYKLKDEGEQKRKEISSYVNDIAKNAEKSLSELKQTK